MKKFTSLAFLVCVLLFFIAVSAASPIDDDDDKSVNIDKRNDVCPQQYKRNVLGKRTYVKKCPCALASAVFDGKVNGLLVYSQDECGTTTVTGFIGNGLNDPSGNYTFQVVNDCDEVIRDLGTLGAKFVDGGAKPFAQKFNDFNLNCDKNGILLTKSAVINKRNYCPKHYYKRQGQGGSYTRIQSGGNTYARAQNSQL